MSAPAKPRLSRRRAEQMTEQAFAAHVAILEAERDKPALATNPYWAALRDAAYARFRALFESEAMR